MKKYLLFGAAFSLLSGGAFAQNEVLYSQDFAEDDALGTMTVVDANNDGKTWVRKSDYDFSLGDYVSFAKAEWHSSNAADDWLFTPTVHLTAGTTYTLKFDTWGGGSWAPERIEVKAGTAPNAAAMTQTLLASTDIVETQSTPNHQEIQFTVTADGDYSIGFHSISDADKVGLMLDNISLEGASAGPVNPGDTVELPYSQTFDSAAAFDSLTVINANDDNRQWEYKDGKGWLQYDSQNAADDWLILPAMNMDAAKAYLLDFDAWAHQGNYFPERIEVKLGNAATAEAMTTTVLEPTMLTNKEDEPVHFQCPVTVDASGVYYIGFHGISDADRDGIFLDNILVDERSLSVPAEATNFTVTPDPSGENIATIAFNAPAVDMTGNTLTALEKVEVLRGDDVIKTFSNPAPGERLEYVDNGASRGLTTYRVAAYSADGRGREVFATVFVGINTPAPVPSVSVVESTTKPGQVTLTWTAPTTDVDGNPINPDKITYEVVERNGIYTQTVIKSGLRGTSYTYQCVPVGEPQAFKQWGVYSYTDNGTKHDTRTERIPVGKPYDAPYTESFAGGEAATITDNYIDGVATEWVGYTDEDKIGAKSQDGDNGFSGLVSQDRGDFARLALGKVSLKGVENPGISFYLYNPTGGLGANLDVFTIEINAGNGWEDFYTCSLSDLALEDRWNRVMVSLEDYKGRSVQLRFSGLVDNGGLILVDNIRIGELYAQNIGAASVTLPSGVKPNTDFSVGVNVANYGTEPFENYDVVLYRFDEEIGRKPGVPVNVCDEVTVSFTDRLNPAMDDVINYSASIVAANDQYADDNDSRTSSLSLIRSTLPAPRELTAEPGESIVTLSWLEPDFSHISTGTMTESFEGASSWAINDVDGWTFIDGDGGETYSLSGYTYPGKNAPMAFQVFDSASAPFDTETGFDAYSGDKYMVSFASKTNQNDDWMISPLLTGEAQTVSFAASSFNVGEGYTYLESFEVLYSTTGTAATDFVKVGEVAEVPAHWTLYSYDLPLGAKYFAIRCTSQNKYIFMVDDVTYAPAQMITPSQLSGYNVYRDSRLVNETPVNALTFTDAPDETGDHTYIVTAVYGTEESDISNLATAYVVVSGVNTVGSDAVSISAEAGRIVVTGNVAASVYTPAGVLVGVIDAAPSAEMAVAPGIYIVKAGNRTAKLNVR